MASTPPSLLFAVPWARPEGRPGRPRARRGDRTCRTGAGPGGSGGPPRRRGRRLGRGSGRCRPRTPSLHADLSDGAEGLKPAEQGRVPVGVGPEGLGAEQAPDLVEGGGHMDLAVSVDATGDGARGSTMVMPSLPFLNSVEGWHGRPEKDDGEGRSGHNRPATHPSRTGRAALDTCARSSGRRGVDNKTCPTIWSQTGNSGAPETTDDQPCSGGSSWELHNIIGVRG